MSFTFTHSKQTSFDAAMITTGHQFSRYSSSSSSSSEMKSEVGLGGIIIVFKICRWNTKIILQVRHELRWQRLQMKHFLLIAGLTLLLHGWPNINLRYLTFQLTFIFICLHLSHFSFNYFLITILLGQYNVSLLVPIGNFQSHLISW